MSQYYVLLIYCYFQCIIQNYIWLSSQVFRGIAAPKFQEHRFVLSNVIQCGHLTAVFYRNISVFLILLANLIFRQISKNRFIIINCSNCRNNELKEQYNVNGWAGPFEELCFLGAGGQFDTICLFRPSYFKKNLSNTNMTLYNRSAIYLKHVESEKYQHHLL